VSCVQIPSLYSLYSNGYSLRKLGFFIGPYFSLKHVLGKIVTSEATYLQIE
jgi:hypothetical protein